MAYMNATRWTLYDANKERYPNVNDVRLYYKYNRIQAGLSKKRIILMLMYHRFCICSVRGTKTVAAENASA